VIPESLPGANHQGTTFMTKPWLFAALVFVAAAHLARADWPAFRGQGQLGQAGDGDYPVRWGPKENIGWKVKLPGPGASSPVVQGQRVFVTCFTGKKAPDLVRYLLCLDRKTGNVLWEKKRPAPQPENDYTKQLLQHGFATSTPIVEGNRVYVNFNRGGVFAFDLDGKEIWQRELGEYLNSFGSGSSLTIVGDLLLVNATVEAGALFALNKTNGETVWKAKVPGDCWSTPVVVEPAKGAREIVLNAQSGLYGFDPESGKELWFCKTVGGYVSSTPVVVKDVLYVTGTNFERRMVLAVRAGGRGDVTKTHVLWQNTKLGASYCSPLVVGDRLFFFSGQAICLNRHTGDVVKQERLEGVTQLYSSPIVAGGKIYVFTRNDGCHVLSADDKLTVLAHNDLEDATTINASPAACDGELFIRTQEYLYCLRKG
jgi:outer membrane protein assembly factor BamB